MSYQDNFKDIESKWRTQWVNVKTYSVDIDETKPKYYVLEMFPYPSAAGLHVGHPLGYIAGDIIARYKRLKGFNVLHPIGFDSFGLPAEQYAIKTGQAPQKTTEEAISNYKEQLNLLGLSYDWDREIRTSAPSYYKWTQYIFTLFYNSYYDTSLDKAISIKQLVEQLESGTHPDSSKWKNTLLCNRDEFLKPYRMAYVSDSEVNWCEDLGTVLANDEISNGKSIRGGHIVIKKNLPQWFLKMSCYGKRLYDGLESLDWHPSIKAVQKDWIVDSETGVTKLRDAVFSRQRYWGEPIPVAREGNKKPNLPIELPHIDNYAPLDGMPALSRVDDWKWDYNTMPGWAGSSWYFLRYLSPDCDTSFVSEEGLKYWKQPDIYIGGSEHAVGHLIYARFWTMFLFDLGLIPFSEPFPKMRNQGMMTAPSYRVARKGDAIYSFDSKPDGCVEEYVEYKYVDFQNDSLLVDEFIKENPHINTSDTSITLRKEVEKMSKSKYNVINPNDIVNTYGADTLRLYEMFMGPIEHSKPWDMNSIQGCYRFIRSVYDYYIDASPNWVDDARSEPKKCLSELSTKIEKDLEDFNLNTIVSSFMVCFKALKDEKTVKQDWVDFIAMLSIYAPFIGAELLDKLDVSNPTYPVYPVYKTTKSILMKIMIGGKFMESCEPMSEQGTLSYVCSKYNIEASKVGKVIFKENFMFNVILC